MVAKEKKDHPLEPAKLSFYLHCLKQVKVLILMAGNYRGNI